MTQEEIQKKHGEMFADGWNPWFDVNDGWLPIVDTALSLIKWDIEHNNMPEVELHQIKEKYGALEIYFSGGNEKTEGIMAMASSMSMHTCDTCGTNQNIGTTGPWIKTICENCAKEQDILESWKLKQ